MSGTLVLRRGVLEIDLASYRVVLGGEPLLLSYREYILLVYLATHAGHVVTKRRLLEEGLGRHDVGGLRRVEETVRQVKAKLERYGRRFVEEADGGYRFLAQDGPFGNVT